MIVNDGKKRYLGLYKTVELYFQKGKAIYKVAGKKWY